MQTLLQETQAALKAVDHALKQPVPPEGLCELSSALSALSVQCGLLARVASARGGNGAGAWAHAAKGQLRLRKANGYNCK